MDLSSFIPESYLAEAKKTLDAKSSESGNDERKKFEKDPSQFRPALVDGKVEVYKAQFYIIHNWEMNSEWCRKFTTHYKQTTIVNPETKKISKQTMFGMCDKHYSPESRDNACCNEFYSRRSAARESEAARAIYDRYFDGFGPGEKYLVNILMINDEVNPENNGKVMWWAMSPTIYKMALSVMSPVVKTQFADEEEAENYIPKPQAVPFDPRGLIKFKFELARKLTENGKKGLPTYDGCEFTFLQRSGDWSKKPISDDTSAETGVIGPNGLAILGQCHSFDAIIAKQYPKVNWSEKISNYIKYCKIEDSKSIRVADGAVADDGVTFRSEHTKGVRQAASLNEIDDETSLPPATTTAKSDPFAPVNDYSAPEPKARKSPVIELDEDDLPF